MMNDTVITQVKISRRPCGGNDITIMFSKAYYPEYDNPFCIFSRGAHFREFEAKTSLRGLEEEHVENIYSMTIGSIDEINFENFVKDIGLTLDHFIINEITYHEETITRRKKIRTRVKMINDE